MKKFFTLMLVVVVAWFMAVVPAAADPRMETNDNFCHFILETEDTDNEIFVAGCNSSITVQEAIEVSDTQAADQEIAEGGTTTQYVASGYAKVVKRMPAAAAPFPAGETREFSSTDGVITPAEGADLVAETVAATTQCAMVESNNTTYNSDNWYSLVKVRRVNNRIVKVVHELFCWDGEKANE